ncbi:hypothetical protein [[Phormidium ambiguum] IAM M-71]|uniref:hypothetical protein n=1 Tax=[Phormidium ambiguum] IAM M-71 TaxID=454136 RepID=UPI0015B90D3F|nr:hypothetical protein [Phormidium ambiguum]
MRKRIDQLKESIHPEELELIGLLLDSWLMANITKARLIEIVSCEYLLKWYAYY